MAVCCSLVCASCVRVRASACVPPACACLCVPLRASACVPLVCPCLSLCQSCKSAAHARTPRSICPSLPYFPPSPASVLRFSGSLPQSVSPFSLPATFFHLSPFPTATRCPPQSPSSVSYFPHSLSLIFRTPFPFSHVITWMCPHSLPHSRASRTCVTDHPSTYACMRKQLLTWERTHTSGLD